MLEVSFVAGVWWLEFAQAQAAAQAVRATQGMFCRGAWGPGQSEAILQLRVSHEVSQQRLPTHTANGGQAGVGR